MRTIDNINNLNKADFLLIFGNVFEKTESVALEAFKSKPFKRFLKIDAAPARSEINVGALENYDGVTEDKLDWLLLGQGDTQLLPSGQLFNYITLDGEEKGDRKFKFRLKSKHTGKILDLNVKFKLRRGKVNENIPTCGEAGYIEKTYPETE